MLKKAVGYLPGSRRLANAYYGFLNTINTFRFRNVLKRGSREEIFTYYYRENGWNNPESASGWGSTLEYTENIRKEIPIVMERFNIHSILDAPCGDYNWFRFVNRGDDAFYLGGDIVPDLIQKNKERYQNQNTSFIQLDIIAEDLPNAELWLCRDALFHFSNADIFAALNNFIKSDINYLFTTTHTECRANADILTGQFRLLNLELPPFNFPPPIQYVDDWIADFPVRKIGLWERKTIKDLLSGEGAD